MLWKRWLRFLAGFGLAAAATLTAQTCTVRLPNSVFVNPPPIVLGGGGDDDGCRGFCVGDFDD